MAFESVLASSTGAARFGRIRRSRTTLLAAIVFGLIFLSTVFSVSSPERREKTKDLWYMGMKSMLGGGGPEELILLRNALKPGTYIKPPKDRVLDLKDTFDDYYRTDDCFLNSLELHEPFHPLCANQEELLNALTDGGRRGMDEPYAPKGCDMRWFSSSEICDIMSRFRMIHVIGDSMMRNLAVALHVYLRKNLVLGPQAQWVGDPEGFDCTCAGTFSTGHCIWASAFSSEAVWEHEPQSMNCPQDNVALVEFNPHLSHPLHEGVPSMVRALPDEKPDKPDVFLYGHGMWNNMSFEATEQWTYTLLNATEKKNPWLTEPGAVFPKLFVTPNAAGDKKPAEFQADQGNPKLLKFEKDIRAWAPSAGVHHLGVYNLTIQSTSPDGTHAGMRANLVKAMMVLNWMNMIDLSHYSA